VRIDLPDGADPFVALFSESTGRALVSVARSEEVRFTDLCAERGLPVARIGVVDLLTPALEVHDLFNLPLRELRTAWAATIPHQFG
jgi:phosphoribosylformylglycinamidine (FGAM) synthase-like enzyme